jgi:hypothetical protein
MERRLSPPEEDDLPGGQEGPQCPRDPANTQQDDGQGAKAQLSLIILSFTCINNRSNTVTDERGGTTEFSFAQLERRDQ